MANKMPESMVKLAALSAAADSMGISYGQYVSLIYQGKILPPYPNKRRRRKGT